MGRQDDGQRNARWRNVFIDFYGMAIQLPSSAETVEAGKPGWVEKKGSPPGTEIQGQTNELMTDSVSAVRLVASPGLWQSFLLRNMMMMVH